MLRVDDALVIYANGKGDGAFVILEGGGETPCYWPSNISPKIAFCEYEPAYFEDNVGGKFCLKCRRNGSGQFQMSAFV
jgi:hypothetical protein